MEEIPQGGAGGVPPHHATDDGEGGHGLRAQSGADGDATTVEPGRARRLAPGEAGGSGGPDESDLDEPDGDPDGGDPDDRP
ncbi:hypothetical protein GCM10009639_08730 [Kitasatospora putterlickiae]|uniref:BatC protein n=1 Tax=Kitasatospora putterlickiae TaxID=221725 RepID=A0ABN1XQM5_9ACTN